jgi:lipopolysaccharide biosynthesis glycosyltransferase
MKSVKEGSKHIVCTIDDNYVQHFIVMLSSLFFQNSKSHFNIFILTEGLSKENEKLIGEFFRDFRNSYLFLKLDPNLLKAAPVFGHVSLATYYRILIPKLLPTEVKKALFLDVDIIINANIDVFWEIELNRHSHIAVENYGISEQKKEELFLLSNQKYFNAGVMMINIDWWRENQIYEKANQFMINHPYKIEFWDQDVLNSILAGQWIELPYSYNAQEFIFSDHKLLNSNKDVVISAYYNPVIIHFSGGGHCKPWYYLCQHKYKYKYYEFLDEKIFKSFIPIGQPILQDNMSKLSIRDKFYLFRRNILKK